MVGVFLAWELQYEHGWPFVAGGSRRRGLVGAARRAHPRAHHEAAAAGQLAGPRRSPRSACWSRCRQPPCCATAPTPARSRASCRPTGWTLWGDVVITVDRLLLLLIAGSADRRAVGALPLHPVRALDRRRRRERARQPARARHLARPHGGVQLGARLGARRLRRDPRRADHHPAGDGDDDPGPGGAGGGSGRRLPLVPDRPARRSAASASAETEANRYIDQQGFGESLPFLVIIVWLVIRGRALPLRDYFLQRLPSVGIGPRQLAVAGRSAARSCVLLLSILDTGWIDAITVTLGVAHRAALDRRADRLRRAAVAGAVRHRRLRRVGRPVVSSPDRACRSCWRC